MGSRHLAGIVSIDFDAHWFVGIANFLHVGEVMFPVVAERDSYHKNGVSTLNERYDVLSRRVTNIPSGWTTENASATAFWRAAKSTSSLSSTEIVDASTPLSINSLDDIKTTTKMIMITMIKLTKIAVICYRDGWSEDQVISELM